MLAGPSGQGRQLKTGEEREILEAAYLKNPAWDYNLKVELAIKLNLTFAQIAKWNWDRKQRDIRQAKRLARKAEKEKAKQLDKKPAKKVGRPKKS